jgi:hypothetical protein
MTNCCLMDPITFLLPPNLSPSTKGISAAFLTTHPRYSSFCSCVSRNICSYHKHGLSSPPHAGLLPSRFLPSPIYFYTPQLQLTQVTSQRQITLNRCRFTLTISPSSIPVRHVTPATFLSRPGQNIVVFASTAYPNSTIIAYLSIIASDTETSIGFCCYYLLQLS